MKEYTIDNINEFFEDLMNKPNAKFNMLRVYGAYERECEDNKRKQEIEDKYDWPGCSYVAHIINDDIAIVEEIYRGDTKGYYSHVNGKKKNILWPTFDQALLCALSIKYTGCEDATKYAMKVLDMEE